MLIQASSTNWFADINHLFVAGGMLLTTLMSIIGYKVHSIIFNMKLPERLTVLETTSDDHENRIHNVEKKLFGI